MIKYILSVLLFCCCLTVDAVRPQSRVTRSSVSEGEPKVFPVVNSQPMFPGGSDALKVWVEKTLRYPVLAEEHNQEAYVVVAFWVTHDGSVKNGRIVRSGGELFDQEVLRVIRFMPRWTPGRENGRPISVRYTMPVTFRLVPDSIYNKKRDKHE